MSKKLEWDSSGNRFYETGVDRGVVYPMNSQGKYTPGVAWNGLISVEETPSGAEPTPLYANNTKYMTLYSVEELDVKIEAYTYPDEFARCDGTAELTPGVIAGQQERKTFGLCYRTKVGNDVAGNDFGHKLHLIYGCKASPSTRKYNTINDSPEAITFSWDVSTTQVAAGELRPTSILVVESKNLNTSKLAKLEEALYGTTNKDPYLPTPDEIVQILTAS